MYVEQLDSIREVAHGQVDVAVSCRQAMVSPVHAASNATRSFHRGREEVAVCSREPACDVQRLKSSPSQAKSRRSIPSRYASDDCSAEKTPKHSVSARPPLARRKFITKACSLSKVQPNSRTLSKVPLPKVLPKVILPSAVKWCIVQGGGREEERKRGREGGGRAAVIASADCSTGSVHTLIQFSHAMLGTKKKERERQKQPWGDITTGRSQSCTLTIECRHTAHVTATIPSFYSFL